MCIYDNIIASLEIKLFHWTTITKDVYIDDNIIASLEIKLFHWTT